MTNEPCPASLQPADALTAHRALWPDGPDGPRSARRKPLLLGSAVAVVALGIVLAIGLVGSVAPMDQRIVSCTLDVTPPDCHVETKVVTHREAPVDLDGISALAAGIPRDPVLLFVGFLFVVVLSETPRVLFGATGGLGWARGRRLELVGNAKAPRKLGLARGRGLVPIAIGAVAIALVATLAIVQPRLGGGHVVGWGRAADASGGRLDPETTRIRVAVWPPTDANPAYGPVDPAFADWLAEPTIEYTSSSVIVTLHTSDDFDAAGVGWSLEPTFLGVELREPLGERTLVDGSGVAPGHVR